MVSGRTYEADVLSALVFADGRNVIGFRYKSGSGAVAASQFRAMMTYGSKSLRVVAVADTAGDCLINVTHMLRTLAADPDADPFPDYSEGYDVCGEVTVSFSFAWRQDGQSSWISVRDTEGGVFVYAVTVRRGRLGRLEQLFKPGEAVRNYFYYPFTIDLPNYSGAKLYRTGVATPVTLPYVSGVPLYSSYRLNLRKYLTSLQTDVERWTVRPAWNADIDEPSDNTALILTVTRDLTPFDLEHYEYIRYLDGCGRLRYLLLRKKSVKRVAKFTELHGGGSLRVVPANEVTVICGAVFLNQGEYSAAVSVVKSPWVERLLFFGAATGEAVWERCAVKGATFQDGVLAVDARDVCHEIELTLAMDDEEGEGVKI